MKFDDVLFWIVTGATVLMVLAAVVVGIVTQSCAERGGTLIRDGVRTTYVLAGKAPVPITVPRYRCDGATR